VLLVSAVVVAAVCVAAVVVAAPVGRRHVLHARPVAATLFRAFVAPGTVARILKIFSEK
jgi:hypothetical protein